MILRIILYVLAAVSIWYSFMIYSIHSGSSFFMVWAVIGVFLALTGIALKTGLCKKHGLYNVYPIPADSDPFYKPNNYLREVLAFIKDSLF
ncbi:MAG: hypothetical protein IK007_05285 [Lachnospiraceae bacterium]|nr:hypothetical protein [Lachnospiraceae bacterium]